MTEEQEAQKNQEDIDKRVQYMIENLMAIRKSGFAEFPGIPKDLDIVDIENQVTHYDNVTLDETHNIEDNTSMFNNHIFVAVVAFVCYV